METRINVGCGRKVLDGWINVDAVHSDLAKRPPEIICDFTEEKIPIESGIADEVMAIHVLEHFYLWDLDRVIADWRRLLKYGGKLTLEMPDIVKCCANIIANTTPNLSYWGLYGDPIHKDSHMCHRWGWTFKTLKPFLQARGFNKIREETTQWHGGGRLNRDFRAVAIKC